MKLVMTALVFMGAWASFSEPAGPKITDINYEGSGCPQGTVAVSTDGNGQSFSLVFNEFVAEPGRVESVVKNCAVLAKIEIPQGYMVAVRPTSFGVEHNFTGASVGRLAIDTLFAGRKASVNVVLGKDGYSTVRTGESGWSRCGGEQDVQLQIKLNARKAAPRDTARAAITHSQTIDLAWRSCH